MVGGNPVGLVTAAFCFLIVLAAIGWGIYEIYQIGHPGPEVSAGATYRRRDAHPGLRPPTERL